MIEIKREERNGTEVCDIIEGLNPQRKIKIIRESNTDCLHEKREPIVKHIVNSGHTRKTE